MQHYKNYPIDGSSVATQGGGWHPRGLVFGSKAQSTREIKHLAARELFCFTKEEAEELAFNLCQSWIDGLAVASKKQG